MYACHYWPSGNTFDFVTGCLRFKSRAGQSVLIVANGSPRLLHSSKGAVLLRHNDAKMGPPTGYALRRSTASIMKKLV